MPEKSSTKHLELSTRFNKMPDIRILHRCLNYQAIHTAYVLYTLDPERRGRRLGGSGDSVSAEIRDLMQSMHGVLPKVSEGKPLPAITLGALMYFCHVVRVHILQVVNGSWLKVQYGREAKVYSVSLSQLVGRWD